MANSQLIKGAFLAAPKFTDTSQAIRQAVLRGETALLRGQAQEQRRQELQAKAIAQLPTLDESKIPAQLRKWATGKALEARQAAINIIQDKTLNPAEKQMKLLEYKDQISEVATKAADFKQWIANFADIKPEDLSKLNSPQLMERINDIYQGKFRVQGDNFVFDSDGATKKFSDLVNTRPIMKRSEAYKAQLNAIGPKYDELGLKGRSLGAFENMVDTEVRKENYTDVDLASIAVDELGITKLPELSSIREDFEVDGKIDDPKLKEKIIEAIKKEYNTVARKRYDIGVSDRKAALKTAKTPANVTPYQYFQMQKYEQEQALENNKYLQRTVSAAQRLADITKENVTDTDKLQAITGLLPIKYDEEGAKEAGLPSAGVLIGEKYFMSDNVDINDARRIIAQAMADSNIIEQSDVEDILMSIRPSGMPEEFDNTNINTDFSNPLGTITSNINN